MCSMGGFGKRVVHDGRKGHFSLETAAFLRFFRVCNSCFHAFMLSEWGSISIASLIMHSMRLVFVARNLVSRNCILWPRSVLCSTTADLSGWYSLTCQWCSLSRSQWNTRYYYVTLTTFRGDAVDTSCFQAKVILDGTKKTGDLPRGARPTVFMLSR
jgi:hypothetical protein